MASLLKKTINKNYSAQKKTNKKKLLWLNNNTNGIKILEYNHNLSVNIKVKLENTK